MITDGPKAKFEQVASTIRRQIVHGKRNPGDRLPTWNELRKQFDVGRPTLTRAMESLKRDGFVVSDSTRGSYVARALPHLRRFALVFADDPHNTKPEGWNRFWSTLAQQASVLADERQLELPIFYNVNAEDAPSCLRLQEELAHCRLGGLILVGRPDLMALPFLDRVHVPVVAAYAGPVAPNIQRVYVDLHSFMTRAVNCLIERNRTRVAIITNDSEVNFPEFDLTRFPELQSKPFWKLAAGRKEAVAPLVQLLFDADNRVRPNALIIADDNIAESCLAALLETSVRVPQDVEIVCHCNWPWPIPSTLPVHRLGFDVHQVLQACIDVLRSPASEKPDTPIRRIPAVFESELSETGVVSPAAASGA